MSGDPRIERRLPGILADLGAGASPDYTDILLARTAATRQRPGWVFPGRWIPMTAISERLNAAPRVPLRAIALVALLLIGLVVTALYVGSQQRRLPPPFGPAANGAIPYTVNGDLYLGDLATGQSRLLVGGPEADALPQFSPDGTRLAFIRDVGTTAVKPIDLYVVNGDGSHLTKITPQPIWDWKWIQWTPDGRGLAVVTNVGAATNQVDVYDTSGNGTAKTIAKLPAIDSVQFRPPDGKEILYQTTVDGVSGLFTMDLDGSNRQLLLSGTWPGGGDFWGGFTYSADGARIFYTRPYLHETPTGTCCSLWVMNADGSGAHQFVPNDGTQWNGGPTVSPDGSKVAFWTASHVSVIRSDGTGPVVQTGPEMANPVHWVWSPDSSKILMYPNDDSSPSAWLLDPDGGPSTKVPWHSDGDLDWQRIATP